MRPLFTTSILTSSLLVLGACSSGDPDLASFESTDLAAPGEPGSDDGTTQPSGSEGSFVPGTDPANPTVPGGEPTGTNGVTPVVQYETVCTPVCSDEPPANQDPNTSCADWKSYGMCEQDWFKGACKQTCGTCDSTEEVCEQVPVTGGATPSIPSDRPGKPTDGSTATPLTGNTQSGWASRYWDCCKPHCAWPGHGANPMNMCTIDDQPLSDPEAVSSCDGGNAYTCSNMAPWAVSDTLAYGYAATPSGANDCGKCYQIDFVGTGYHNAKDPGSVAIKGKTMIVQSTNIGHDVASGQFDLLLPGGGVGAFNGCSKQWGTNDLGAQYGGFLSECKEDVSCLRNACQKTFSGMPELLAGCMFHADWLQGANNPNLKYAEVPCPAELEQISGMSR